MDEPSLKFKIIVAFTLMLSQSYVLAAPPRTPQFPTTIEPARTGEAISNRPLIEEPMLSPETQVHILHGQTLPPEMAKLKFKMTAVRIEHPVVYTCEELLEPFQSDIGKVVTLGDIQEIANKITTRYQQAGYILTQVIIPPQHIRDGVVTLEVVAGHIDKVFVSGDVCPALKELVLAYGAKIQDPCPMQMADLERYTLLINDIPGVTAKAVLTPSKTTPQTVDVTYIVEEHYLSGFAAVNNYGTKYLGPVQGFLGVELDSGIQVGDSTQLQVVTTANKQLNFVELRHKEIIGCEGLKVGIYGQYLHEVPDFTLSPFDVKGTYGVVGADFLYPIIRSRQTNLSLNGGFMVLDSKTTILGTSLYDDHIRPLYLGLNYSHQDSFQGVNQAAITLTQGLKILGASGQSNISRPKGESVFTKITPSVSRYQALPCDFSLMVLVQGQYSFDTLLSSQQFGFGGSLVGRGYDPSEIVGDDGVGGTLELRYDSYIVPETLSSQYYVFYDAGIVWNRDPTFLYSRASATSTGVGVRLKFLQNFEGNLYIAKPLTRNVATFANRDIRVFFSLLLKL